MKGKLSIGYVCSMGEQAYNLKTDKETFMATLDMKQIRKIAKWINKLVRQSKTAGMSKDDLWAKLKEKGLLPENRAARAWMIKEASLIAVGTDANRHYYHPLFAPGDDQPPAETEDNEGEPGERVIELFPKGNKGQVQITGVKGGKRKLKKVKRIVIYFTSEE